MKTMNIKFMISTAAAKTWESLDLPVMVTDEKGQVYMIASIPTPVANGATETLYSITNMLTGEMDFRVHPSVRDLVKYYEDLESDFKFTPVKIDVHINEMIDVV